MYRSWDVKDNLIPSHQKKGIRGREFTLKVRLADVTEPRLFYSTDLTELLRQGLQWRRHALSAVITSFKDEVILSSRQMMNLWAADAGCYGTPSKTAPFIIRGPVINPMAFEWYESQDLLEAFGFAKSWFYCDEEPYWIVVRGPNGRTILRAADLEKIHLLELEAQGCPITRHVVVSLKGGTRRRRVEYRLPESSQPLSAQTTFMLPDQHREISSPH